MTAERDVLRGSFLETYRSSGYAALATSFIAVKFFDPFFAMTILAIASSTWTFKAAMTRDEQARALVRERRGPLIAAIVGSALVGFHILDISLGITSSF